MKKKLNDKLEIVKRSDKYDLLIGIDTGVKTGFAVWDGKQLLQCKTEMIHNAFIQVLELAKVYDICVYVEDARKRGNSSSKSQSKAQGAGSVKRDAKAWEDLLIDYDIPFRLIAPSRSTTKMDALPFKNLTKFEGRTSNHARDAAMIVFGKIMNK